MEVQVIFQHLIFYQDIFQQHDFSMTFSNSLCLLGHFLAKKFGHFPASQLFQDIFQQNFSDIFQLPTSDKFQLGNFDQNHVARHNTLCCHSQSFFPFKRDTFSVTVLRYYILSYRVGEILPKSGKNQKIKNHTISVVAKT